MSAIAPRTALSDAIRYWERGRVIYNLVLAAIVLGYFVANWPGSASRLSPESAQGIFLLAVLANVAYCAAYIPDMVAQLSDWRPIWLRLRWIVFAIGLGFASIITRFIAHGMFTNAA
jgi:hypothetical protein